MTPLSDKVFFSYATVAPMCQDAFEAAKIYLDEFYRIGPPDVLYEYDPYADLLAAEAATLLNCTPENITYIKNTTEGINIAADALPLEKSDEILVLQNEYPANLLPWRKKQKDGYNVTFIPGTDSPQAFQRLIESITNKTKAISISACQYYDGYITPLKQLSEICRNKNIYLILDAVQLVGIRKIDLQETPVDFLLCGGQKYLRAGPGIGFMYVNPAIMDTLREPRVGIRSMEHFDPAGYTLKSSAARFQDGTQNLAGIVALHASLKSINAIGIETIESKNLELLRSIKNELSAHNIPFIDHGDNQGNIISMQVHDPNALTSYLKEHMVFIKTIQDVARLSFIHETSLEDVTILAQLTDDWLSQSN